MEARPPAPPGRLVDVGGFRLHLNLQGTGAPLVVFDAALGGSSLSWSLVQPIVARVTATCSYDRAGFGWSDAGPTPRTAGRIADELHRLLMAGGQAPPYILVGHSFGALAARVFAARHAAEVAGLVLVEPAIPEDWVDPNAHERARMRRGIRLCHQGSVAARLGLARLVSRLVGAGAITLARRLVTVITGGGFERQHEEILAPIRRLPAHERALLRWMWTQPKFFDALGSQIASICTSAEEALSAPLSIDTLPLVVVSATAPHPHHVAMQERLARMSRRGRRLVAPASGHWVPLDAPAFVAEVVTSMVDDLRRPGP